jgi:hypothetical protein
MVARGEVVALGRSCGFGEKLLLFFLNFKGTPSQKEHKIIFSGLKIYKMALSNHIDFLAFFSLRKIT